MANINNKKVNPKKIMIIIGCVIMLAVIAAICFEVVFSGNNNTETNPAQPQEVIKDGFDIETPYVTLSYPLKWKEEVKIQHIDSGVYTVEFYLPIEGKDDLHLFDIAFGGEDGDSIGLLNSNDSKIDVRVISYEIGADWSDKELDTIGEMLEDVNHIIRNLENNENFEGFNI